MSGKTLSYGLPAAELLFTLTLLILCAVADGLATQANAAKHPFTISDEIGLTLFNSLDGGSPDIQISPDGRYVAIWAEQGLIAQDRMQDQIRIYDLALLRRFVENNAIRTAPNPIKIFQKATFSQGPVISGIHWLNDSGSLAALVKTASGSSQIWLIDVAHGTERALTPVDQDVISFDIRDASHFAYTVRSPGTAVNSAKLGNTAPLTATGMDLLSILQVSQNKVSGLAPGDRSELWAVQGDALFRVTDSTTKGPVLVYTAGQRSMRLSPDGRSLSMLLPLANVPAEWVGRYPQGRGLAGGPGRQDLNAPFGVIYVSVSAVIDLSRGKVTQLADAPGFWGWGWLSLVYQSVWSDDGGSVAISVTGMPARPGLPPCLAVARLAARTIECVEPEKVPADPGKSFDSAVRSIRFAEGRSDQLIAVYTVLADNGSTHDEVKVFTRSADGHWSSETKPPSIAPKPAIEITVKQNVSEAPTLVATDSATHRSRMVWNPNPQLDGIELGAASVYHWKDKTGRAWTGGLYLPAGYLAGQRYPLVIQTHNFDENVFTPNGRFPSAHAARELAARGVAVLQTADCPIRSTPDEGPCQLPGYEAVIQQLADEGVIDPKRVGISGFSRTCIYVMDAITAGNLHFAAAAITDGVNHGYFQYLIDVDWGGTAANRDAEEGIGAPPLGAGLQTWMQRSPEFNLDKVTAPLRVVGLGRVSALSMWEPYAMLRRQHKPTDFIVINSDIREHVLTNPANRLAAQGGTVDWFRFWLQGYEDPAPDKADQYRRWEGQCDMQIAENTGQPTFCVPTKHDEGSSRRRS